MLKKCAAVFYCSGFLLRGVSSIICVQCSEARFINGTQMCRNDGKIFCEKLKKLEYKYQVSEWGQSDKKKGK